MKIRFFFYLTFVLVMSISPNVGLGENLGEAPTPMPDEEPIAKAVPVGIQDYLSVGALFISNREPYKGLSRENRILPAVGLQYKNLTVFGPIVQYELFSKPNHCSFSLVGEFKFFDGYESGDALEFTGMDERKGTAYLGAKFQKQISLMQLEIAYVKDVLSEHGGANADIGLSTRLPISILFGRLVGIDSLPLTLLSPKFGIKYYSTKYVNYYFGVKDSEITPERAGYAASDGFAFFLRLGLWVKLSSNLSWSSMYRLELLPSDIKNSPLVERSNTSFYLTSLSYLFFL